LRLAVTHHFHRRTFDSLGARSRARFPALALPLASIALGITACGQVDRSATASPAAPTPTAAIEIRAVDDDSPPGPDAPPRVELFASTGDARRAVAGRFVHAVPFRNGAAAVTTERQLTLVHPDGTSSVLAHEVDGLPARASDGSLVYAERFGEVVEIHSLSVAGDNRRLATVRGSATRLAPQPDGAVIFTGALLGKVQGVWVVDGRGTRCLSNCNLQVGRPFDGAFRPLPAEASVVRVVGRRVEWQTAEGTSESAPLETERR
jgi:hypothetical protein